jgi:hypothetical protein
VCETQKLHPPIRPKNPTPRKNRVSSLQCARVVKGWGAQTRCSPLPITSVRHRRRQFSTRATYESRAKPQVSARGHVTGRAKQGRFARRLQGSKAPRLQERIYAVPEHDYRDHPSGKFIFFKNALNRGSPSIFLNAGSPLIIDNRLSFCAYALSSHLSASPGSPRNP